MTRLLHYFPLLLILLSSNVLLSQSNHIEGELAVVYTSDSHIDHEEHHFLEKKVFSYNSFYLKGEHSSFHNDHDHDHELAGMDIISSDEGFDFNCSGGFCMNKSHFHKKGLTPKKQLFRYFMRIAC